MDRLRGWLEWLRTRRKWRTAVLIALGAIVIIIAVVAYRSSQRVQRTGIRRTEAFAQWGSGDPAARAPLITTQREACPGAPFILPSEGFIGLLYGDPRGPYSLNHPHQGIDIFSPTEAGVTPVYAAYDGYITREPGWKSALIQRVPEDPLQPDRQIWLYYTHMADVTGETSFIDDAFPPGTSEVYVEQGTLLGYTGDYSGSTRTIWVHLHFSIVRDDGQGHYTNELEFDNTVDPSRYLGMPVNIGCAPTVPQCSAEPMCEDAVLGAGGS
jgi:murein DD-endopeptidase MepM/ murein hydrolase activator NlpD